jgi:hypothetical protein
MDRVQPVNTLADQRRHGRDAVGWTPGEKNLIATAAARAPLIHNTRPWVLEFHDPERRVSLYERLDRAVLRHDPLGRDRLISCGGALEHVRDEGHALLAAHSTAGVRLRPVRGNDELSALAKLLHDTTAVPDIPTLTDRLRGELLVVVETPDDGPLDHVRVGLAAAEIWLAATAAGLAAPLLTHLFHLPEIRAGLVESLSLNGFPQLLLRFGQPIDQLEER